VVTEELIELKPELIKSKQAIADLQEAEKKEITEDTTITVTEEIIDIREDIEMVDEEKTKKKKVIRRKSKPDHGTKVTTEEIIALKPTEETLVDESIEEIKPDIESEIDVERKKKLVKKLTKPKESTAELQEVDEKEITEETTVS
ncbi:hypothetical protein BLA29_013493, partial [Euroglyphus maynei]